MSRHKKIKEPSLLGQYAGFVSRFIAVLIDIIIIIAMLIGLAWVGNLIIEFFQLRSVFEAIIETFPWLENVILFLTFFTSVTFVFFAYTVLLWVFTGGSTVGKAVMGVRIVRIDGSRLTFWRAWGRYIMFWVAVIPLGLGLLWVLINDERRGWHDLVCGTCVIYDWEAREDVHLLRGIRNRIEHWNKTRRRISRTTQQITGANDSSIEQIPASTTDNAQTSETVSQDNS